MAAAFITPELFRFLTELRAHNERGWFEVFVGAAVLANNLLRIADLLRQRAARRRRAA